LSLMPPVSVTMQALKLDAAALLPLELLPLFDGDDLLPQAARASTPAAARTPSLIPRDARKIRLLCTLFSGTRLMWRIPLLTVTLNP
jgi:hypothetical protein